MAEKKAYVNMCVNFTLTEGKETAKNGFKITGIAPHALAKGDTRYVVQSNYGTGTEIYVVSSSVIEKATKYNCPGEKVGGRRRTTRKTKRKLKRKACKSRRR